MASAVVVVTGIKQIDALLATCAPKLQRKLAQKSLRNAAKLVVKDAKAIIKAEAYNLGVVHDSLKVRALKRKRGRLGVSMFVDREKLFEDYKEEYGHPPHPLEGEAEPHYYLASIEFGTETQPAVRPMRRALYGNLEQCRAMFAADMRAFLNEVAVTGATANGVAEPTNSELREAAVAAGEVAYRDVSGRLQSTKGGFVGLTKAKAMGYRGK